MVSGGRALPASRVFSERLGSYLELLAEVFGHLGLSDLLAFLYFSDSKTFSSLGLPDVLKSLRD